MRTRRLLLLLPLVLVPACSTTAPPPSAPAAASKPAPAAPAAAPAGPTVPWQHEWARGAVFYEVFVRSFADGNGDGKGDLAGLIAKLDYLNDGNPATTTDLGVDALWLMPIFASPSYHGYDTVDYGKINPDYGTLDDLERLCREAHRRGIKVVLDLVLNHSSDKHPWFVDSSSSTSAKLRDWYVWRKDDPGWKQPWGPNPTWHLSNATGQYYYGIFWGGMPDLNYRNPAVVAEMKRVARFWLDHGVDGFRLDAARHIVEDGPGDLQNDTPETHAFWTDFSAYVRSIAPQSVLIGENWSSTPTIATYYGDVTRVAGGDQLPMNFDFPLAGAILDSAKAGDAIAIKSALDDIAREYPPGIIDTPFLTNHDMQRVASQLGGDVAKLKSAAAVLLTLPGAPFIYYGEELGMQNGPGREDEQKRTPMPWDGSATGGFTTGTPWFAFAPGHDAANVAAEAADANSLLRWYKALIAARHASDALQRGDFKVVGGVPDAVLAFTRTSPKQRVLVVHNLGTAPQSFERMGLAKSTLLETPGIEVKGNTVTLPPNASAIYEM